MEDEARTYVEAGVSLAGMEKGTATDLGRFADGEFDAVLLMGPLYHLLADGDRRQALAEAIHGCVEHLLAISIKLACPAGATRDENVWERQHLAGNE